MRLVRIMMVVMVGRDLFVGLGWRRWGGRMGGMEFCMTQPFFHCMICIGSIRISFLGEL